MAESLHDYLDDCKKRLKATSDRQMSSKLGWPHNRIGNYRTERALPTDKTVIELAEKSGRDPEEALILAAIWRAENEKTRNHLGNVLRKLAGVCALVFVICAAANVDSAYAIDSQANIQSASDQRINIMRETAHSLAHKVKTKILRMVQSLQCKKRCLNLGQPLI